MIVIIEFMKYNTQIRYFTRVYVYIHTTHIDIFEWYIHWSDNRIQTPILSAPRKNIGLSNLI